MSDTSFYYDSRSSHVIDMIDILVKHNIFHELFNFYYYSILGHTLAPSDFKTETVESC